MDNLYRTVEKLVCGLRPGYRDEWKERQSSTLERFSLDLLERLLPGSTIIRSARYQWPPTSSVEKNWTECDGLVIFDDHLIIVEARSGSFTYTAPTNDFNAHIQSVMNLLEKPWKQAGRFLDYLNNSDSVSVYREVSPGQYVEVQHLRRKDFRVVTACGVTLDNFGHLAARAEKLQPLGVATVTNPLWSVAIDDLMICADVFESAVMFCHFLEQRQEASKNPRFELRDEVDHLGMYFSRNMYSTLTEDAPQKAKLVWSGFGSVIDEYFSDLLADPATASGTCQRL